MIELILLSMPLLISQPCVSTLVRCPAQLVPVTYEIVLRGPVGDLTVYERICREEQCQETRKGTLPAR